LRNNEEEIITFFKGLNSEQSKRERFIVWAYGHTAELCSIFSFSLKSYYLPGDLFQGTFKGFFIGWKMGSGLDL